MFVPTYQTERGSNFDGQIIIIMQKKSNLIGN